MLTLCLSLLLLISPNSQITDKKETVMKFELVSLPYATDALAPVIGKSTIEFHHGKHLLAYVNNLNNLIPGTKFENADLETIVKESDGAIFNNAGQVLNHNLYFTQFSPKGGGKPSGELAKAIENHKLFITKEGNAGNPVTKGLTPLLGFDVWEHSYYLDYQNRRADHLNELWKIVDWNVVGKRY